MMRFFVFSVSIAFLSGCLLAFTIPIPVWCAALAVVVFAGCMFLLRRYAIWICIIAVGIGFSFGVMRITHHIENQNTGIWESLHSSEVHIEGIVTSDIEHRRTRSKYVVAVEAVTDVTGKVIHADGSVLVLESYPTACVTGGRVSMTTILFEPEDFLTDTGRLFQYKEYLSQQGIYATALPDASTCNGSAEQFAPFAKLRKLFIDALHRVLPVQEASLLGGLLLGLRGMLSDEMLHAFRVTGLIHIIVLSGYNITLVAEAVRRLLSRTPHFVSLIGSLIMIVAFVLLAGSQTAAVRAGAMATIASIARASNREHDGIAVLTLVGACMILYNPEQLIHSASFHMSFLATLGLLLFSPILEQRLVWISDRFQLRSIIAATLATQLFLLPYLAYAIGEVSIIGIVANIVVLPLVPIAMLFGALLIPVTLVSPIFGAVVAPIALAPLATIIFITNLLAVPYATVPLAEVSAFWTLCSVALLTYIGLQLQSNPYNDPDG